MGWRWSPRRITPSKKDPPGKKRPIQFPDGPKRFDKNDMLETATQEMGWLLEARSHCLGYAQLLYC